jgi:hypothetical protein
VKSSGVNSLGSTSTSQLPVLSRITASSQIPDRRLTVGGLKAASEVVLRHASHPGEPIEVKWLAVVAIDVVAGPPQVCQ